jgi:hypothetical protein
MKEAAGLPVSETSLDVNESRLHGTISQKAVMFIL